VSLNNTKLKSHGITAKQERKPDELTYELTSIPGQKSEMAVIERAVPIASCSERLKVFACFSDTLEAQELGDLDLVRASSAMRRAE
jgi:hypothetical protein